MTKSSFIALAAAAVVAFSAHAHARPVAIVEDASGPGITVQPMELLEEGAVIELPEGGKVVLGYLASCLREHIAGGKVIVGADQSDVEGGQVTRETVACQSASASPGAEGGQAGALIFRGGPDSPSFPPKVRDVNPAFLVDGAAGGTLVIERIDRQEPVREIPGQGPLYDTLDEGRPLSRGGHYRARLGDRQAEFKVDRYAGLSTLAPLERIVRF